MFAGMLGSVIMGAVGGAGKKSQTSILGGVKTRHRRRKSLTVSQRNDILFLKEAVGRTAAANYITLLRR